MKGLREGRGDGSGKHRAGVKDWGARPDLTSGRPSRGEGEEAVLAHPEVWREE